MPPTKRPAETPAPGDEAARRVAGAAPKSAAEIAAQVAAAKAKIAALRGGAGSAGSAAAIPPANGSSNGVRPPASGTPAAPVLDIAAIQARIRAANAARNASGAGSNGTIAGAEVKSSSARVSSRSQRQILYAQWLTRMFVAPRASQEERPSGIHPLLMAQAGGSGTTAGGATVNGAGSTSSIAGASRNPYANRQAGQNLPKFSSIGANARLSSSSTLVGASATGSLGPSSAPVAEKTNPYLSNVQPQDGVGAGADPSGAAGAAASRKSQHRPLTFHKPGRHIKEAEELRREHMLEQLKLRIQESTRKAGLEEGLEGERALRKEAPPEVEWWDAAYLPASTYDAVSLLPKDAAGPSDLPPPLPEEPSSDPAGVLLIGSGTPIDSYVQHPIPIPAPTDKIVVEPRGVMLTKKEMKKMRKQRRAVTLQDRRDRIKMGLLPPDPPKVKLSNLMRVLTSEAVADPTKVEAKVRREVAARKEAHERANNERKLTKDERWLKEEGKRQKDEMKGVFVCVYKILHLASPSHKFKVRANAKQFGLTGLCIFHPSFALVVVEGASKGIKGYERLMTHRINWNDPGRVRGDGGEEEEDVEANGEETDAAAAAAASSSHQQQQLEAIDWSSNYCSLLFEGPIRERLIQKGFVLRNVESDIEAKEALGPRMESYWGLAKREGVVEGDVI